MSFIDVGQGDSTLVRSGGESYLIDGGKPEAAPEVVDFLKSRGVDELDAVVATHPDSDHIGGLPEVLESFDVSRVYLSGVVTGSATQKAFLRAVRDEGAEVVRARAGMEMEWGETEASVLSPPPESDGGLFEGTNENSVVLLLEKDGARILLTGDVENQGEEYISTGPYRGAVTALKVAHHGSSSSTTPLFLNRFPPEIAVISVGADNSYGHPTPQTLQRLKTVGARIFRTDRDGDVILTVEDGEVEVAVTDY